MLMLLLMLLLLLMMMLLLVVVAVVVDVVVVDVVVVVAVAAVVVVGITACNNLCVKLFKICIKTTNVPRLHEVPAYLKICVSPRPNATFQNMLPV